MKLHSNTILQVSFQPITLSLILLQQFLKLLISRGIAFVFRQSSFDLIIGLHSVLKVSLSLLLALDLLNKLADALSLRLHESLLLAFLDHNCLSDKLIHLFLAFLELLAHLAILLDLPLLHV